MYAWLTTVVMLASCFGGLLAPAGTLACIGVLIPVTFVGSRSLWNAVGGLSLSPAEAILYASAPGIVTRLFTSTRTISQGVAKRILAAWVVILLLVPGVLGAVASTALAVKAWLGLAQWVAWFSLASVSLRSRHVWAIQAWWVGLAAVGSVVDVAMMAVGKSLFRASGLAGDANFWGTFLLLATSSLVVGSVRMRRWARYLLLTLLLLDGLLTGSRSFLMTGAIVLLSLRILTARPGWKKISAGALPALLLGLGLGAALLLVGPDAWALLYGRNLAGRAQVYGWTFANVDRLLVRGVGPENMALVYDQWAPFDEVLESGKTAHNMYFQVFVAGGLVPTVAFVALLALVVLPVWRGLSNTIGRERVLLAALFTQLVVLLSEGLFLDLAWSPVLWAVMGMCNAASSRSSSLSRSIEEGIQDY